MTTYRDINLSNEGMRRELLPCSASVTRKNGEHTIRHYVVIGCMSMKRYWLPTSCLLCQFGEFKQRDWCVLIYE